MRLDKALLERGLVRTRSQAKSLIEGKSVQVNGKTCEKASFLVNEKDKLEVSESCKFVSRGALKLEYALKEFELNPAEKICADIGASTGGFTQVLLNAGAKRVYAIDVGHGQLDQELQVDDRVINLEKTNIKYPLELNEKVDLFVCDVSFISLKLIFQNMSNLLKKNGYGIVLIKPQFEAGKGMLGKGGLVSDKVRQSVLVDMRNWFQDNQFKVESIIESPVKGNKSGNVEFLAYYIKD